jgi:acyl carrier protein phosphodiesterase
MNYLAHAYLSFNVPGILVGNMISDHVKGKKQFDFPNEIQHGIRLHRLIDEYTDTHEATRGLKSFFKPQYRLYSGAFADVVYDHFLANDPTVFQTEQQLKEFTAATYETLGSYTELFPAPFQKMFPYMKEHDWLYNYRYPWGIEKSFGGVARRAVYLTESNIAFGIFTKHHAAMKSCYEAFFPGLEKFAAGHLDELLNP